MEMVLTVTHVIIAIVLIGLVLLQDSKGSSLGGAFGSGGSNSVFGATGAVTMAQKLTRYIAILFAFSCIVLTITYSKHPKSIIDTLPAAATTPATTDKPAEANSMTQPTATTETAPEKK
jgi:preprotein translocase subunit SecG